MVKRLSCAVDASPSTTPRTLPDTAPDISHAAADPTKPSALYSVSDHSLPPELGMDSVSSSDMFNTPVTLIDDVNNLFDSSNGVGKICFAS